MTKLQPSGLLEQAAGRKTANSFIFSFKERELIKIVPGGCEFYGLIFKRHSSSNDCCPSFCFSKQV